MLILLLLCTGAYLATHESRNFGGDTPEKGTTPNLKFWKFANFDKQIVYIGVIDPPETESGITFWLFLSKTWKNLKKLVGQIVSQIRPCTQLRAEVILHAGLVRG